MLHRLGTALSAIALLSACGGGGGGNGGTGGGSGQATPPPTAGTPPPPPTASAGCSVRERQDFVNTVLTANYLFPDLLPADRTPTEPTVEAYIDRLTKAAADQNKDRGFTFITSIAEENAFIRSGSSAGFGVRILLEGQRLFVTEAFEGAPALAAGIDRGTEILAIGNTSADARSVADIYGAAATEEQRRQGARNVSAALGPTTAGTARFLRFRDAAGNTREATVTKADFALQPVSSRYGAKIIDEGGKRVGYVNLRTFIQTADPALRDAFLQFRNAGVTEVIMDFRYNGGGLVNTAELIGDLLGRNRSTSDIFSITVYQPGRRAEEIRRFMPQPQSIAPTKIAFIGTGGTASASELVINAFVPYLGNQAALIGTNTFGKPVGQEAFDRPVCDDRLRVVSFATLNANRQGEYYTGLANTVGASCQAGDDLSRQLGDPQEASTRQALDYLAGRTCTPIARTAKADDRALAANAFGRKELLVPDKPSTVQREVPGAF